MSKASLQKVYCSDVVQNDKMIKIIKNKLTPLSETQKYPMGKHTFLYFKNLQKLPKLKKQNFALKRNSQLQEAIVNSFIQKKLDKGQKKISQDIYQRPSNWLRLWKKTGDKFQHDYLSGSENHQTTICFPQQTRYPQDFHLRIRQRNSQHHSLTKITKTLLKKVQIFKFKKKQEMEQKKKQRLKKVHKSNKYLNIENQSTNQQNKQNSLNSHNLNNVDELLINKDKNNDWVHFITQFIFNQHVPKSQQQKLYQQYSARKGQNLLKDFIKLLEPNKKTDSQSLHFNHIANQGDQKSFTCRYQPLKFKPNIIKSNQNTLRSEFKHHSYNPSHHAPKNSQLIQYSQYKKNQLLQYNPTTKLKRLKSLCKSISLNADEQERNQPTPYNCSKLRINSNHKKIVETVKNLGKS